MMYKPLTVLLQGFHRGPVWRVPATPIGRTKHVAVRFVGKLQEQIGSDAVRLGKS
ncbi:hypothetical protein V1289_003395 [Bradyrhizobium sp. AZCC 2289]